MAILPVLKEELERLIDMEKGYVAKISVLPRGSIRKRLINGKPYYYLVYREGSKVKNKYVRLSELEELKFKISLRQKYEKNLFEVRKDCRVLKKVILK